MAGAGLASVERLIEKNHQADLIFQRLGVAFSVYDNGEGTERLISFDAFSRIRDDDPYFNELSRRRSEGLRSVDRQVGKDNAEDRRLSFGHRLPTSSPSAIVNGRAGRWV